MKKQISKIFSSDGELSKNIKGFKPRAEQLEMAQSVGYAIQHKRSLVVEAGTGTGKTFCLFGTGTHCWKENNHFNWI